MKLIVTVGLPRSGKSTWAIKQGFPIVNPDSIRLALHGKSFEPNAEDMVWTMAVYMIKSLFFAGHPTVIVDATHITEKRRNVYHHKIHGAEIEFKVFHASQEICLERAAFNAVHLIPVIQRMETEQDFREVFK